MSAQTWAVIKRSKRFYVRTYRKLGSVLFGSAILNVILGLANTYVYLTMPESDFYATYGDTPPILLTALNSPNYSSTPLLADDRRYETGTREIPK